MASARAVLFGLALGGAPGRPVEFLQPVHL
jgi:ADP-ribosylglycohydrolase